MTDTIESKHATESVTTWGIVILTASQMMGAGITPGEAATVANAASELIGTYSHALAAIGIIMAALGRVNAKQPIHFMQPYKITPDGKRVLEVPADVKSAMADRANKPGGALA